MAKVILLERDQSRRVFPLGDRLSIGRDWSNEMQLLDVKVSRNHARVIRGDHGYFLQDLASHNGTFLNEERITEEQLNHGDRIRIGDHVMLFEDEGHKQRLSPSPPSVLSEFETQHPALTVTLHGDLQALFLKEKERESKNEELVRVRRDLTALFEISNILNTERDQDSLYEKIAERIAQIIKADALFLLEMKEIAGERQPVVRVHRGPNGAPEENEALPLPSKAVLKQVLDRNDSVLVTDAEQDIRIKTAESVIMNRLRSVMCVPIRSRAQTLGLIYATDSTRAGMFTRHDLELLTAIGIEAGIALENQMLYTEMEQLFLATIEALAATIDAKDGYTAGHSRRVADNAVATARELGLSESEQKELFLGGILHDIGKIGIPDKVLQYPGAFGPEHRRSMERHPTIGAEILRPIPRLKRVAQMVRHHHEWFDGMGYPDGLAGNDIPLQARIITVADTFDAITSTRIYRSGRSVASAVEILKGSTGHQVDPEVLAAFLRALDREKIMVSREVDA